jgi:hypothetical protein
MYNPFRFLILPVIFISCMGGEHKNEIRVSGTIGHGAGEKVYFKEVDLSGINVLDSAVLASQGTFSFRFEPEGAGFYLITLKQRQWILVMDKGDRVEISGDLDRPDDSIRITGSEESILLRDFFIETARNKSEADSLTAILKAHIGSPRFYELSDSLEPVFGAILESQQELEKDYIRSHPQSLTSLIVLNYAFGPSAVLPLEDNFALYLELDSTLSGKYPGNKHVVRHHQRVSEYQREKVVKKLREEEGKKK